VFHAADGEDFHGRREDLRHPPAVAWAVRSGRCWLRARCRCAALLVLVLISTLAMPNCGAFKLCVVLLLFVPCIQSTECLSQ
jgi:hypothetical protein